MKNSVIPLFSGWQQNSALLHSWLPDEIAEADRRSIRNVAGNALVGVGREQALQRMDDARSLLLSIDAENEAELRREFEL
jgi:hypothetical protein